MIHKIDIIGAALAASAPAAITPIVATSFTGISWVSFLIALIVAAFASLTKYYIDTGKKESEIENPSMISYCLSGVLAGLLVYLFVSYLNIHPNLVLMSTGFAGYSGEVVLKMGPVKWAQDMLQGRDKN